MNILIPTIGSRGDVQPYIALAQGLDSAGHSVTLVSHPVMRNLVESHGVTFAPIGPDIDLAREVAEIRQSSGNIIVGLVRGMRFGLQMVDMAHDDIMALGKGTELVVISGQSATGKNEADLKGLPYLSVTLMPWAIPWDDPARPLPKRIAYGLIDWLAEQITTRPLNRMRNRLGLPGVGQEGFTSKRLNLVPVSPEIYPPNPHWESRHHIVGYWFANAPQDWQPADDLGAFLEDGAPPVLISLGAMSLGDQDALEMASLFVEAVQGAGIRAIIQGWGAGMNQLTLPAPVYAAGSLPHSWLLTRCAGLVHHGGFGTTAVGFRAGLPALVIPHIGDQFFWGEKVQELGVGPEPIRRTQLNTSVLVAALSELVEKVELRTAALNLGEKLRYETGVENAVRLIEETFLRTSNRISISAGKVARRF